MSEKVIIDFHKFLSDRADYGAAGEKPIFLMAALRYILTKDVLRVSLTDLLHPKHRLRMKSHFLYFAGVGGRLKAPKRSWTMVAGKENLEIKSAISEYVSGIADVSEAFAKLRKGNAENLLARFLKELENASK